MKYYKRLPLEGMSNCRDLGGYPTKDGKITNYGVFIRSEAPVNLNKDDINLLKEYGITKSLDFRGEADLKLFPSSLNCEDFEYVHLPMFGRADALGFDSYEKDPGEGFTGWGKNYIQWLECYKGWIRDVFKEFAECKRACQYNCNAGKDRTGIASALLLSVAGAEPNDIVFDYCISRAMLKPRFPQLEKQWGDYLKDENGRLISNHPFLYTPMEAMTQMLRYLYSEYNGAKNYLLSCDVSEAQILEIKHKLTA